MKQYQRDQLVGRLTSFDQTAAEWKRGWEEESEGGKGETAPGGDDGDGDDVYYGDGYGDGDDDGDGDDGYHDDGDDMGLDDAVMISLKGVCKMQNFYLDFLSLWATTERGDMIMMGHQAIHNDCNNNNNNHNNNDNDNNHNNNNNGPSGDSPPSYSPPPPPPPDKEVLRCHDIVFACLRLSLCW